MGRKRSLKSEADFQRALKNKYGVGEGINYKPWIRVQDFSSHGIREPILGIKTGRLHHFLSLLEERFFHIAEFHEQVIDIREQFPLFPISYTQKIANLLGVDHPSIVAAKSDKNISKDTKSKIDVVMTTDFLLTIKKNNRIIYRAISVKPESGFTDTRILEKMEIERVFWESLGVNFNCFTGNELTEIQSANISWFSARFREKSDFFSDEQINLALSIIQVGSHLRDDIYQQLIDEQIVKDIGAATLLFQFLIFSRNIIVDLTFNIPASEFISIDWVSDIRRDLYGTG